jgi:hypothetical protein
MLSRVRSHVLRTIQGAYYHGNGGCQTVDIVLRSENHNQRRTVAMQILGATANRAVHYSRFEICFCTDPESDQAYRSQAL